MGASVAWPNAARAQKSAIPVVGYLSGTSPDDSINIVADFRRGLAETGYVEGRNVAIEYRWLEGRYDRIRTMLNVRAFGAHCQKQTSLNASAQ
jgi:putative ABC transport system substrate-binding protein